MRKLTGAEKTPELLTELFRQGTEELIDCLSSVWDGTVQWVHTHVLMLMLYPLYVTMCHIRKIFAFFRNRNPSDGYFAAKYHFISFHSVFILASKYLCLRWLWAYLPPHLFCIMYKYSEFFKHRLIGWGFQSFGEMNFSVGLFNFELSTRKMPQDDAAAIKAAKLSIDEARCCFRTSSATQIHNKWVPK